MNTKRLTVSGLLLACAVILPQIFHMIGGPGLGSILLPMHIPVLVAGFIVGPVAGLLVGILSPICSFIYTGGSMPGIPMMYLMVVELAVYGFAAGVIYQKTKGIWISLIGSMIVGRVARGLMFVLLTQVVGMNLPAAMGVWVGMVNGLPGIVLQLVIIPPVIFILQKKGWEQS